MRDVPVSAAIDVVWPRHLLGDLAAARRQHPPAAQLARGPLDELIGSPPRITGGDLPRLVGLAEHGHTADPPGPAACGAAPEMPPHASEEYEARDA
jgi:hypothetical protein